MVFCSTYYQQLIKPLAGKVFYLMNASKASTGTSSSTRQIRASNNSVIAAIAFAIPHNIGSSSNTTVTKYS